MQVKFCGWFFMALGYDDLTLVHACESKQAVAWPFVGTQLASALWRRSTTRSEAVRRILQLSPLPQCSKRPGLEQGGNTHFVTFHWILRFGKNSFGVLGEGGK